MINKHLVRELSSAGMWSEDIKNRIVANRGSVQSISKIPTNLRSVFRTAWEIPQKSILDMAADRGAFICQSQSLNIHMDKPSISKLTSLHFHAWKIGLKTGMYYLRTRPMADPIQFTVNRKLLSEQRNSASEQEELQSNVCVSYGGVANCDYCSA